MQCRKYRWSPSNMTLQHRHHYLSLCMIHARQRVWPLLEQICKQVSRSGRGSQGKAPSLQVHEHRAGRALGQGGQMRCPCGPRIYLSLISIDFCPSLKIFTNTSWRLCPQTVILSCLFPCRGRETSNLDISRAPGLTTLVGSTPVKGIKWSPRVGAPALSVLTA